MTFEESDLLLNLRGPSDDKQLYIALQKYHPVEIRLDGILVDHIEMISEKKFWLTSIDWCLDYCCRSLNNVLNDARKEILCSREQHSDKYVEKYSADELDYKHLKCILLSGNPKPKSSIDCIFLNFSYDPIYVSKRRRAYGLKCYAVIKNKKED